MRSLRGAGVWLAGAALVVGRLGLASGKSQLVMKETFAMNKELCDEVSCRKQIIGANETFGLAAHTMCTHGTTYGKPTIPPTHNLFELVYHCRPGYPGEKSIDTKDGCGISSVCLDAGTNPETSDVTYQIAFDFVSDAQLNVEVDVELYFNYREVTDSFYTVAESVPVFCDLAETCHRSCADNELLFYAKLTDNMGDGWNAGGINLFNTFRLDKRETLDSRRLPDSSGTAAYTDIAVARKTSYENTILHGYSRNVPVCMSDGEYLFSTDFAVPASAEGADGCGTIDESSWTFCGLQGKKLSELAYFRVVEGECSEIGGWGETPQPATTPTVGILPTPPPTPSSTPAPTPAPTPTLTPDTNVINGDAPADNGDTTGTDGDDSLEEWEIFAIGFGALGLAGIAAAGGTYAQNKGWFAPPGAAAGAAAGAGGVGGGAAAPNPDVDEFAP